MQNIMTYSVAQQMNFAGWGGKNAIKYMTLLKVIIGRLIGLIYVNFPALFNCMFVFKLC